MDIKSCLQNLLRISNIISNLYPNNIYFFNLQSGMSCTNNVRKVMNVEISSRFNNNLCVTFINNDVVLEWWKDDVKKMRLFCSDGFSLTAYGFSVMLDHWMVG